MAELSIFVDESGDMGETSKYYLIGLVLQEQSLDFDFYNDTYMSKLAESNLADVPFHFSPLMNGHDDYQDMELDKRKAYLAKFRRFSEQLPFKYHVFAYRKRYFSSAQNLISRMKRDLSTFLSNNLKYFQTFDQVKIYYDNGQGAVTDTLVHSIRQTLSRQAGVFKVAHPQSHRLAQLADYVCGLELVSIKYESHQHTSTDELFFGGSTAFKKNFLRKLRKKHLP